MQRRIVRFYFWKYNRKRSTAYLCLVIICISVAKMSTRSCTKFLSKLQQSFSSNFAHILHDRSLEQFLARYRRVGRSIGRYVCARSHRYATRVAKRKATWHGEVWKREKRNTLGGLAPNRVSLVFDASNIPLGARRVRSPRGRSGQIDTVFCFKWR